MGVKIAGDHGEVVRLGWQPKSSAEATDGTNEAGGEVAGRGSKLAEQALYGAQMRQRVQQQANQQTPPSDPVRGMIDDVVRQSQTAPVGLGYLTRTEVNPGLGVVNAPTQDGVYARTTPADPAPPSPTTSPDEALEQIKALPKPSYEGIPRNLPPEDRQAIYKSRVEEYNRKRAAIADQSIKNAQPPKREDLKSFPPRLAELEYRDALANYHSQIAELKKISREAKQANLEMSPEFQGLTPENRQLVCVQLAKNEGQPADVDTLLNLVKTTGFTKLALDEQKKLLNYVGGINNEISRPARRELNRLLSDPSVNKEYPDAFRKFMTDQPGLTFVVSETTEPGEFNAKRRSYKISGPQEVKEFEFHSGKADALRYEVEINGRKIPVYMPVKPDPKQIYHTIDEVVRGLAALPQASRDRINSVQVNPQRNPDDAYWEKEYGIPGFRSYMTAGADGNISIYPGGFSQEVLDTTLIHETGHIISGQELSGNSVTDLTGGTTWSDWEEAMKKDGFSASQYARSSPGEDFSETLALYMKVKGTPEEVEVRALMPARFKIIDDLLGN